MELSFRQRVPDAQHVSLYIGFELWHTSGPAGEGSASRQTALRAQTYRCQKLDDSHGATEAQSNMRG